MAFIMETVILAKSDIFIKGTDQKSQLLFPGAEPLRTKATHADEPRRMKDSRSYLQLLQLLVDTGQVLSLVHVDQLALQLAQPLVQALVALHQQVGLVGLEELPCFGLGGALQVLPALSDLLQLLTHHRAELRLLLDQLLALLEGHQVRGTHAPEP